MCLCELSHRHLRPSGWLSGGRRLGERFRAGKGARSGRSRHARRNRLLEEQRILASTTAEAKVTPGILAKRTRHLADYYAT